ncbi:hypothetical protein ABZ177_24835 [Streptomyces sp. NPDC006284]|uniref:hypothetical protein n=1 Tax=Streptomyces sp. NPDC006284 TaxID=3156742 RepID=UPI0033AA4257
MTHRWTALTVAVGFTLTGHFRNRFALLLTAFFIPTWIYLVRATAVRKAVTFENSALGIELTASMSRTIQISSALHAVTVIAGFMMFMATFSARDMDQRLVLAGYPRPQLLAGQVVALLVITVVLTCYTTVLLRLSWQLTQLWSVAAAVAGASLAYGGLGILAGYLLRGELEGFFVVVMATLIDVGLQSPVSNPAGDQRGLSVLPLYGPSQAALAAAFTSTPALRCAARALPWFVATSLLAMLVFALRTRHYSRQHLAPAPARADAVEAG